MTMTEPTADECFVGIDVAKDRVAVATVPVVEGWEATTDKAGLARLVVQLRQRAPRLIVVEATGGLEAVVVAALHLAALAALVAGRWQVLEMLNAEQQRLTRAAKAVRLRIQAPIGWLQQERGELDQELRQQLRAREVWREQDDLLQSVPELARSSV